MSWPSADGRPGPAVRVLGLGGSLKPGSRSLSALRVSLAGAPAAGAQTELLEIGDLELPFHAPGSADEVPEAARRLAETVYACDALILSSPLYHGSVSGSFKNAIDWLQLLARREPPYLTDKVVGLIAAAGGTQGLQAINTMEFIVRARCGWAVPLVVPVARAWQAFDREGAVHDAAVRESLRGTRSRGGAGRPSSRPQWHVRLRRGPPGGSRAAGRGGPQLQRPTRPRRLRRWLSRASVRHTEVYP